MKTIEFGRQRGRPKRTIVVVYGELEVWAFVKERPRWLAQDGRTQRTAAHTFIKKHAEYFKGFDIELMVLPTLPRHIRVNYNC